MELKTHRLQQQQLQQPIQPLLLIPQALPIQLIQHLQNQIQQLQHPMFAMLIQSLSLQGNQLLDLI